MAIDKEFSKEEKIAMPFMKLEQKRLHADMAKAESELTKNVFVEQAFIFFNNYEYLSQNPDFLKAELEIIKNTMKEYVDLEIVKDEAITQVTLYEEDFYGSLAEGMRREMKRRKEEKK